MRFTISSARSTACIALFVVLLHGTVSYSQQQVHEPNLINPEWTQDYQPFCIAANVYYVGTYDLASYLITTPEGHILINTGLASSADMITRHVTALGFKPEDIKILLTNQAHFDHMGGMAAIKKLTGATLMIDKGDVEVVEDGGNSDYLFGGHGAMYEPMKVDRVLHDEDKIKLGGTELTVLHHPGHTKGSCSYMLTVKDEIRSYKLLIANMPTMLDEVDPHGMETYPEVAKDFEYTYKQMPKLKFDIWVAAHASQFNLHAKHKPEDRYEPLKFGNRQEYLDAIARYHKAYMDKKRKKS